MSLRKLAFTFLLSASFGVSDAFAHGPAMLEPYSGSSAAIA